MSTPIDIHISQHKSLNAGGNSLCGNEQGPRQSRMHYEYDSFLLKLNSKPDLKGPHGVAYHRWCPCCEAMLIAQKGTEEFLGTF